MTRKRMACGKSCIRHKVTDLFPKSEFENRRVHGSTCLPDIVFVDLLQYIKHIYPGTNTDTTHYDPDAERIQDYGGTVGYFQHVVLNAAGMSMDCNGLYVKDQLSEYDNRSMLTVVVSVDKYDLVCTARKIVHGKRKSDKWTEDLEDGAFECPFSHELVKYPFSQITEDKGVNSKNLFSFIFISLINKLKDFEFNRDIRFIFDGHCISNEYILMITNEDIGEVENPYCTPLELICRTNGDVQFGWLRAFKNEIGEGDFLPFFYIKNYKNLSNVEYTQTAKRVCADIYSIDTDSTIYSLMYLGLRDAQGYNHEDIFVGHSKLKKGQDMHWIDIRKLTVLVEEKFMEYAGSKVMYPGLQLGAACLAVGSDYTERHEQYPQPHFIEGYVEYSYSIQDLVSYTGDEKSFYPLKLNGAAYTKYIATGYMFPKLKQKNWSSFDPKDHKDNFFKEVKDKMIRCHPLSDKFWLPSPQDMILSAQQFQYYLNMLGKLGESRVDVYMAETNMELYGYSMKENSDTGIVGPMRMIHKYNEDEIISETERVLGVEQTRKKMDLNKKALLKKREREEAEQNGEGDGTGPKKKRRKAVG